MKRLIALTVIVSSWLAFAVAPQVDSAAPRLDPAVPPIVAPAEEGDVRVRDAHLHYRLQGNGEPLVFIHGILGNYQEWSSYVDAFAPRYRVLTYSRRYSWPNANKFKISKDPLQDDTDDLLWLVRVKKLKHLNLVGESYGAVVALNFAIKHPDMVKTLTVSEPLLMRWLPDAPGGDALWKSFLDTGYVNTKRDLLAGKNDTADRTFLDAIQPGAFESIPTAQLDPLYRSSDDLRAVLLTTGGFPTVDRLDLHQIKAPILIVAGEKSSDAMGIIAREVAKAAGGVPVVTIADADHSMISEQPVAVQNALAAFLGEHARP